jgi:hypothetical protein
MILIHLSRSTTGSNKLQQARHISTANYFQGSLHNLALVSLTPIKGLGKKQDT